MIWRAVWGVGGWGRANGMKYMRNVILACSAYCSVKIHKQRMIEIWRAVWDVGGWGRANGMKHKRNPRAPHAALSEQP